MDWPDVAAEGAGKLLGALIIDLMETETAVQHEGRKGECRS